MLSFLLDTSVVKFSPEQADLTVLEYLRENQNLCGSKEGCASGDCGACTVVLAEIIEGETNSATKLHYRPVNACITFMSALQGKQLITVEHLANKQKLHPVQQSMVDHHGLQCGFCTPGFIMSMFALYHQNSEVNREGVVHALSGNLCRCTGYRPIIDATLDACSQKQADKFSHNETQTLQQLSALQSSENQQGKLLTPHSRASLQAAIKANPTAPLFAGSTDLALQVTQQLKHFEKLISLSQVKELKQLTVEHEGLRVGAALPLSDIEPSLLTHFPNLKELVERFASYPVRNQATLGGNVANASPIGDMPPVLLALNAEVSVDNGSKRRTIAAKDFFLDYRKTAMQQGEWIESIFLPFLSPKSQLRAYKISKRMEDDISAVCAVFNIELDNNLITNIQCGFGGVAATPASVDLLNILKNQAWTDASTYEAGALILSKAFKPIDDVRASKDYRQKMVINLWRRFWLETNVQNKGITTRVVQIEVTNEELGHA